MSMSPFRDPVHGFIDVRPGEREIIDSLPFQRLRSIKQLSLTHLVYHGAEHTRFGHSIGVMHLVTKAFRSVVASDQNLFSKEKQAWYEQILRLMALTHDLGHAPFSHGSESVFPNGLEHEDFTERIVLDTEIAEYIGRIGQGFVNQFGREYDINAELICSIYLGKNITNPDFIFLRKFMDSELDCDKMDYLLRDSLYCGVNYGKFDLERLISSLTAFRDRENIFLAIKRGGIHAFEEFILARYFMFVQVYFHKTRRFLDKMLVDFLSSCLPEGRYPSNAKEYLQWDDARVLSLLKATPNGNTAAERLLHRNIMKCVYESPTHADLQELRLYNLLKADLKRAFGDDALLFDSADKMAHKIPMRYELDSEQAIPIILDYSDKPSTISMESSIIRKMTDPINILRIYAREDVAEQATKYVRERMNDMMG